MALDSVLSATMIPPPPRSAAPAVVAASGSSSAGSGSNSPATTGAATAAATGSAHHSSDIATKFSDKGKGSAAPSSSNTKANATASSQAKQNLAQVQFTGSVASAKSDTTQQTQTSGPSFLQTLAQSQADAQDSASATAAAEPEAVTGGKSKADSGEHADTSPASLAFLSQSLAAAMAGVQQPSQGQAASPLDDSTDAVSLTSGSSVQNILANLTKATADELKVTTGPTDDLKEGAPLPVASDADGSSSAASAFQAHMSVGSHLQPTAASTDAAGSKVSASVGTADFNDE
ncbi:MAG: hypothetical protein ACRETD_02465, partial [Steroidobacteraceae bacterium]